MIRTGIKFLTQAIFIFGSLHAQAHVTVKPGEAGIGTYQPFSVSVPVEKDLPTTGVRLTIPAGVTAVMPNAKAGWKIDLTYLAADAGGNGQKDAERPRKQVTEIAWTGGVIPAGQRDDFVFSAKVPSVESTLQWKAYQQYQDGTIVAWERDPKEPAAKNAAGKSDFSKSGPFSQTRVVDDLKKSSYPADLPLWLSIGAILLDLDDPSRVIGRLSEPILRPARGSRDGYVANVVYSCGGMLHGDTLVLPYGCNDSSIRVALVHVPTLLSALVA